MVTKLGKYEIKRELGKGAMGIVYLGHDVSLGRPAALKVMAAILANDSDLVKRFYQEAISAGKLSHPNIVTIYDIDIADGIPYIAMEYLEGQTLQQAIRDQQNFSIIRKLDIITQAAKGLHFAHQNGVIHRDVKPSNIVILNSGPVKILDFGIAHLEGSGLTLAGSIMGTPYYMSPEQVRGETVDGRSDIFSLGVVLYETFSMRTPFAGSTIPSVMNRICNTTPPPLADLIADCPPELNHIAQKAIAKNREDRYQTAEDLAFDLSRLMTSLRRGMLEEEFERGERLFQQGDLSSAEECLRKVLALDSSHNLARLTLRKLQDQARQQRVERFERLLARAEEAGKARHDDECLALANEALGIEPTDAQAQRLRKEVTERLEFRQALDKRIAEVRWLWQKGDLAAAREELRQALAVAPHDPRVTELLNEMTRQAAEQRLAPQQALQPVPSAGAASDRQAEASNIQASADLDSIRRRAIEDAQALLRRRNFASAVESIEQTIVSTGETSELAALLNLALEEQRKEAQVHNQPAPQPSTPTGPSSAQGAGPPSQTRSPSTDALLENVRRNWAQIESQRVETMRLARDLVEKGDTARALALLDSAPESFRRDEGFQRLVDQAHKTMSQGPTVSGGDAPAASGPGALDLDLARPGELGSELEIVRHEPAPLEVSEAVPPIAFEPLVPESKRRARSPRRNVVQALLVAAATVIVVIGLLWVLAARRPPSAPPQPVVSSQPTTPPEPVATPPSAPGPVAVQPNPVESSPPPSQPQPRPSRKRPIATRIDTAHGQPAGGPPEFGSLTVAAPEAGVPIVLDGTGDPAWVTPHTFPNLRSGLHHIGVLFKGHESYRDVDVQAGVANSVSLAPETATGYLRVSTDPSGVEVALDGVTIGVSPLQERIPPGSHTVTAKLPSGVQSKSIMVTENSLADLKFP